MRTQLPLGISSFVSSLVLIISIQKVLTQTEFSCRQMVFNCECGTKGYVFQATVKQCHVWLPPEQACTKFQNCLECESGVDTCVACPPNRYGRRCSGVCQCKGDELCNRDTGQCEQKGNAGGITAVPTVAVIQPRLCTPPKVERPIEQKLLESQGRLYKIEYSCPNDMSLSGAQTISCNDGKWDNNPPECRVKGCRRPEDIPNGRIEEFLLPNGIRVGNRESEKTSPGDQIFMIGTVVVYRCNAYYKITNRGQRTCLDDGNWNGEQLRCKADCGMSEFSPKIPTIVGGEVTKLGYWPWQAALLNRSNHLFCGGSLVSETWVVTAAHCVSRTAAGSIKVFLGKYYRYSDDEYVQERTVDNILQYPSYIEGLLDGDIALLALNAPIQLTARVYPVCLTKQSISFRNIEVGKSGVVTGWGLTENGTHSDVLKRAVLSVISNDDCEKRHSAAVKDIFIVTVNMFCAGVPDGTSDICGGDSGGPMVFPYETDEGIKWYLEGIVSWGSKKGCAQKELYSGFARVVNFLFWIYRYVDNLP